MTNTAIERDAVEPDAAAPAVRAPGNFDHLAKQPPDALLALIGAYRRDPRPDKLDLGVGVYRDASGATPVLRAIKAAEHRLFEAQTTKAYLGPEGDAGFFERLTPLVFGLTSPGKRMSGLQTPGGTGALRLAGELLARARPEARIIVGTPTWPNHLPIFAAARLTAVTYNYFDVTTQSVRFDEIMSAFDAAQHGDSVLLHGCCHNPLGADLDIAQWAAVADIVAQRGLLPLIDLAYQGLGDGLEADAAGLRLVLAAADEALVAYSCDKNFGLYRERTGALFALSGSADTAGIVQSNLLSLARANWSMPPDHGAALVRIILEDEALAADWRDELGSMQARIVNIRGQLAAASPMLAPLATQKGMFSTLPLSPGQVRELRETHGIYMAGSGRINVAGLTPDTVAPFAAALAAVG